MPDIFNLWNLHEMAGVYELDVTMAEAFQVHQGSDEWGRRALAQLGVHAAGLTYTIVRSRCFYYSNYPEDKEWRGWPRQVKLTEEMSAWRDKVRGAQS